MPLQTQALGCGPFSLKPSEHERLWFVSASDERPLSVLTPWQKTVRVFAELVCDYQWPTRVVTALLALLVELLVGISIKRQQVLDQLDSTDHYTIGCALTCGYFRNFLVGALLVMEAKGSRLHVIEPHSVEELRTLENAIWPQLQPDFNARTEEVAAVARVDHKPLRRCIIVVACWGDVRKPPGGLSHYFAHRGRLLGHLEPMGPPQRPSPCRRCAAGGLSAIADQRFFSPLA